MDGESLHDRVLLVITPSTFSWTRKGIPGPVRVQVCRPVSDIILLPFSESFFPRHLVEYTRVIGLFLFLSLTKSERGQELPDTTVHEFGIKV